jgi:hypothetical protein
MRKVLTTTAASLVAALVAGCVGGPKPVEVAEILPPVYTLPTIEKKSLYAGIYFSPQFASAKYMRHLGPDTYVLPIGEASVFLFQYAFRSAFSRTTRVYDLSPDALAAAGVDVAIAPSLEYFNLRHGFDGDGPSRRWSVAYRLTLYSRAGVPVASWPVVGDDPEGFWFPGAKSDLNAAGRDFLDGFRRQAGPALSAIAHNADGKSGAIDRTAVVMTAQPTALQGVEPELAAALRQAGVQPIQVTVRSASPRKLIVRGSDTRLVLANGQTIAPASVGSIVSAMENPDTSALAWGFGGILGAIAAAQSQQEQLGQMTSVVGNALLAERTLENGKDSSDVVMYRLPGGAPLASGTTLRAWIVDPAAATGVQLEVPLTGASAAVARAPRTATAKPAVAENPPTKTKPGAEPRPKVTPMASATPSAASVVHAPAPPPAALPPAGGPEGVHVGDRWAYRFVDSRDGHSVSRKFQVTGVDSNAIFERIELDDGRIATAAHHGGAYLNMTGGMQYAPYHFAFQSSAAPGEVDRVKVEGGDACATRRYAAGDYAASYACQVRAVFSGTETVTVPAGPFQAYVVRVNVVAERTHGGFRTIPVVTGKFWISPDAHRMVKAIVDYDAERPWTETMELVSMKVEADQSTQAQSSAVSAAPRPSVLAAPASASTAAPTVAALRAPPDGVILGDLLAMGAKKLTGDETRAVLTSGVIRGVTPTGAEVVMSYNRDGSLTGSINGNDIADGKWRIDGWGRGCVDLWIPKYKRSYENLCRHWFMLGESLYFPSDDEFDRNRSARMSKRTLAPR